MIKNNSKEQLVYQHAQLIKLTCFSLTGAIVFFLLYWILSNSLEEVTSIFAGGVLVLILNGIALLAHKKHVKPASWLLIGLLFLLVTIDLISYGIESLSAAFYVIPILLTAFCLGKWLALGMATLSSAVGWLTAWVEISTSHTQTPVDTSLLTFNAPMLTIILFSVAIISGYWGNAPSKQTSSSV